VQLYTSNNEATSGRLKSQGSKIPVEVGGEFGLGNLSLKQNRVSAIFNTWSLLDIFMSNS